MKQNSFIAIIPARYASTRFPGKPLAEIGGKTMIERVYTQVRKAVDRVWVATDDERIADEVRRFGGNIVMTSASHPSGTDRLKEAASKVAAPNDIIINVQGDEPFIDPAQINAVKGCFNDDATAIATLARKFKAADGFKRLSDPNLVKVVTGADGHALYFSRSVIPYFRSKEAEEWPSCHQYLTHIGMYAYRYPVLMEIASLQRSPLEIAESLEQLRWLEKGYTIKVALSDAPTIGIDTPADLEDAIEFLNHNKEIYG